jgi:hypothetical protein
VDAVTCRRCGSELTGWPNQASVGGPKALPRTHVPVSKRSPHSLPTVLVALLLVLGGPAPVVGQPDLPPERQVPILTRALAYDENLRSRAGDELVVAILAKAGSKTSEQTAEAVGKAFSGLAGIKVQGLPLRSARVNFSNAANLAGAVQKDGIDVIYICPGLDSELAGILEVARTSHVLSMGSREEYINKGASLGVFLISSKPTICVNLAASKAEGAAFGSDLLRLAKVIR